LALLSLALLALHGCAVDQALYRYNHGVDAKSTESKIRWYTGAIRFRPDYAKAYVNRGLAYIDMGLHNKAIVDLNKGIALFKTKGDKQDLAVALESRGVAYKKIGKFDQPIADYGKAIELNPDYARHYYHRGIAYELKGRIGKALSVRPETL